MDATADDTAAAGETAGGGRFERIAQVPAYHRVAETIEREILAGRLLPGAHIGTEADLVRQLGVNRSTVREGIRLLEQSGLIHRDAGRRLVVSLPRYGKLASRITRAHVLHQVTFHELWQVTEALEPLSAEFAANAVAAGQVPAEMLDGLAENLSRARACQGDPKRLSELDTEFHALIGRAAGNRVLELAREPLSLLFQPTSQMLGERVDVASGRMLEAHTRIAEAVRAGDAVTAGQWMRRHILDYRRGFDRLGLDPRRSVESLYQGHMQERSGRESSGG